MKIDKQLRLVLDCVREKETFHIYAEPLPTDVFERYALAFAQTFQMIYAKGAQIAGPRVAKALFTDCILSDLPNVSETFSQEKRSKAEQEIRDGLEQDFFGPMRAAAIIFAAQDGKWAQIQIDDAVKMGLLSDEDVSEVENVLTFFTVLYHVHRKTEREPELSRLLAPWGGHIVSSTFTEYRSSLPTLTQGENTGEKAALSSIPV